jgi:hypothetical protein
MFVLSFRVMKIPPALVCFALGTIWATAGDYQIKTVKVLPIESYPARIELSGVTIAADPYENDAKSYTAFDIKNLNSRGYYPVHVIIRNGSGKYLTIRTRNIVLITPSGQQLYSTPATVLVDDVGDLKQNKVGSPLSDFTAKELTSRGVDTGSETDGFLFFFTSTPKKPDFFVGTTLYIPKLEEEGTGKGFGPFAIRLDPALKRK